MTPKRLLARDPGLLTEAEFSGLVVELARLGGWTHRYHTFNAKRSNHGFPDWVFVKGSRLLFVELKSEKGRVSVQQQEWIDALSVVEAFVGAFVKVRVWRPSDWDEVVETLTGKRQRAAA